MAYQFTTYQLINPQDAAIYCYSSEYASKINTYAKKWNQLPELYLYTTTNAAGASIVSSVSNDDKGFYGRTSYDEGGHAVGLAHTQKQNESISVMRALNFNHKAYPLADDKAGIAALY